MTYYMVLLYTMSICETCCAVTVVYNTVPMHTRIRVHTAQVHYPYIIHIMFSTSHISKKIN